MMGYQRVFDNLMHKSHLVYAGACAAACLLVSFPALGADTKQVMDAPLIIAQAGTHSSRGTAGSRLATDPAGTRSIPVAAARGNTPTPPGQTELQD